MASQHEIAFEAEQEVLPDRLDALEPPAVELRCEPRRRRARVRRLDLHALAHERLQATRRAVQRVPLRHGTSVPAVQVSVMLLSSLMPGLNIAALARRTGVAPDTLRKWEQRYGVLRPNRTAGGQRRYTEADVARVEWLRARDRKSVV